MTPDLATMSNVVFNLDEPEKRILKYLALKGPMNLSELAQHTTKYAYSLDRWSLKKHLEGSSRFIGLIPYEYVSSIKNNKKETKYDLTTKGVLASLSFTLLDEIIQYQNYVKVLKDYFPHEGIENFIKGVITEFIKLVLFWHYLNGINLTNLKSSEFYFSNFIDGVRRLQEINITHSQIQENPEFSETIRNCIIYTTIIDLITSGELFRSYSILSLVDWKRTKKWQKGGISNEYFFGSNLWYWPHIMGRSTYTELEGNMDVRRLSEFYSDEIIDEVNIKLEQHKIEFLKWKDKLNAPPRF